MDEGRLVKRVRREYGCSERDATERVREYARFMELKAAAKDWDASVLSPSPVVDQVWHLHVLDTRAYSADCVKAHKRMIHHDPDGGEDPRARAKRYEATLRRYWQRFGSAPPEVLWPPSYPDRDEANDLILEVRALSSSADPLYCSVRSLMTVEQLKREIQNQNGTPVEKQRLVFKGRCLADERTLESCGITASDNKLHIVLASRGC